jgi:hypothetical protein
MRKRPQGRQLRYTLAGALACATIGSFAAVAGAGSLQVSSASRQYQYQYHGQAKVTLCHHTHSAKHPFVTITVGEPAVPAHLRHGDTLGPCPPTRSSTHGRS